MIIFKTTWVTMRGDFSGAFLAISLVPRPWLARLSRNEGVCIVKEGYTFESGG